VRLKEKLASQSKNASALAYTHVVYTQDSQLENKKPQVPSIEWIEA